MDYNINENRLVFVKIDKTGLDRFLRFTENRSVIVQKIQNLNVFEKRKTKKLKRQTQKTSNKLVKPVGLPFYPKFEF
jgi:hypothetical protein